MVESKPVLALKLVVDSSLSNLFQCHPVPPMIVKLERVMRPNKQPITQCLLLLHRKRPESLKVLAIFALNNKKQLTKTWMNK